MSALNVSLANRFVNYHYKTCIAYKTGVNQRGTFPGEGRAGHHTLNVFMLQVALAFCISQIMYFVLRPLKQSKVVCDVLVCMLILSYLYVQNIMYLKNK